MSDSKSLSLSLQDKKLIVGGLALLGFGFTLARVTRGGGKIKFPGEVDPSLSGSEKAVHMKVATYMFATKALMTATTLVGCAGLATTMGISYYLNVNSLKEFASELTRITKRTFPSLSLMTEQELAQDTLKSTNSSEEQELAAIVEEWTAAIKQADDEAESETVLFLKKHLRQKFFG